VCEEIAGSKEHVLFVGTGQDGGSIIANATYKVNKTAHDLLREVVLRERPFSEEEAVETLLRLYPDRSSLQVRSEIQLFLNDLLNLGIIERIG
jgi:hypothetical protein